MSDLIYNYITIKTNWHWSHLVWGIDIVIYLSLNKIKFNILTPGPADA